MLAERFAISGGDIKNAVLKAAASAAAEPLPDKEKRIHQQHLERAIADVLAAKDVMRQSLFEVEDSRPRLSERGQRRAAVLHPLLAIYIAASAFVMALIALTIVLLR